MVLYFCLSGVYMGTYDITVVYVVRYQASTITLWYTVFSWLLSAPSAISLGPVLLLHIAEEQERNYRDESDDVNDENDIVHEFSGLYFDT